MNASQKARYLVDNELVFLIKETERNEYYFVKSSQDDFHEVIFNKDKSSYLCSCKNIKFEDCSHKIACKLLKEKNESR